MSGIPIVRPGATAVIEVVLMKDGHVTCSGPLANRIMCLGMLEEAKNIINRLVDGHPVAVAPEPGNGSRNGGN